MVDFVKLAATAKRLIEKNGRDITLVTPADTVLRDANKPWRGVDMARNNGNEVELIVKAAFLQVGTDTQFGEDEESESTLLIRDNSKIFLIASTSLGVSDIRSFTEIRDGTTVYNIVNITILKPADIELIAFVEVEN